MVYLNEHLKKYPNMQLIDILKLHLQGILGPRHLIKDKNIVLKNLNEEYESIKNLDLKDNLIEEISDNYVRVYLYPYQKKCSSFNLLVEAFYLSTFEKNDIVEFIDSVKKLINKENEVFINQYLESNNYLISHSKEYKEAYNPHYLVIHRKYIDLALGGDKMKSKVYFTRSLESSKVLELYHLLGVKLEGNVCIKVHSGEPGNQNFLKPDFWKEIIEEVNGTVVECNTAYEGRRNTTSKHLETFKEHGWNIFPIDLLDAEGPDLELDIPNGKVIKKNYLGKNAVKYDSMLVLSHFKGHPMGGYGGAIKQLSIGLASSYGKAYIHGAGEPSKIWTADHDLFLESMADAASSVVNYFKGKIVYINVMKNMSVDCDCCAVAEDPCIKDIGILASLDPIAIDQACIDLVYNCNDEKKEHLIERIESRNGIHTIEAASELGFGSREYDLIEIE